MSRGGVAGGGREDEQGRGLTLGQGSSRRWSRRTEEAAWISRDFPRPKPSARAKGHAVRLRAAPSARGGEISRLAQLRDCLGAAQRPDAAYPRRRGGYPSPSA